MSTLIKFVWRTDHPYSKSLCYRPPRGGHLSRTGHIGGLYGSLYGMPTLRTKTTTGPPSKHLVCLINLYSLNTASGDLKNSPYLNEIPNVIPSNTTAGVKPESKPKSTRLTVKLITLISFLIVSEQLYGSYLAIPLGNCNPWRTANRVLVD
jgi:hypothetical protein